jgi:hypothetical protein
LCASPGAGATRPCAPEKGLGGEELARPARLSRLRVVVI